MERKAIIGNIMKIIIAYSVHSDYEYMQPVHSKIISGCLISGPKVSIPVKVSGIRTGDYEYVQPVRSQNFFFLELVALYLAL